MSAAPNAEQIHYWHEVTGRRWVDSQERMDAMIEGVGEAAMDRAGVRPGESVVDVGCGCGGTSLGLARRVGSEGAVLGVDVSGPMLLRAEARVAAAGLTQVRFVRSDAQTHAFEPQASLVFSRFGVMFFEDPVAAFANLRTALAPDGRLAFVCWQPIDRNPWLGRPLQVLGRFVTPPAPPAPGAPGPFAFADPDRVRSILDAAGFPAVELEDHPWRQRLGGSVEEALAMQLEGVGPVANALVDAAPDVRAAVSEALRRLLAGFETQRGVELDAAVWIVTARRG